MAGRRGSYLAGLATGLVAGAAGVAILSRLFACREAEPSADEVMRAEGALPASASSPAAKFVSRRDNPESAGDPRTVTGIQFRRPGGGAPGPRDRAEQLAMPGRPGQIVDHADASQKVSSARKTVALKEKPKTENS